MADTKKTTEKGMDTIKALDDACKAFRALMTDDNIYIHECYLSMEIKLKKGNGGKVLLNDLKRK